MSKVKYKKSMVAIAGLWTKADKAGILAKSNKIILTSNSYTSESINEKSIVFTDKSASYIDISKYVEVHLMEKSNAQVTKETLRWVHIAISNAKRTFLVVFHKIKGYNLQRYLNEFVYKLNRRYCRSNFEKVKPPFIFQNISSL